ncbi:MAG: hypothetical protein J3R72DRAFT_493525 [Linnemannia gamsii]|nr:MAG: hypothetical protein J3R72DRAFT_493525 [Linnemannia gamsii]
MTQRRTNPSPTTSDTTPSVDPPTIWYLAYGSNLSPQILTESRKIIPLETKRVRVPDYWLSMDLGGIPFSEPCFASILKIERERMGDKEYAVEVHRRCRVGQELAWEDGEDVEGRKGSYPMELHGVVYRITERDWELIVHSEGGWGHDVPIGYDTIHVACQVYDTLEQVTARVLLARPKSLQPNGQPSLRYKSLITSGARYHNLDPLYQAQLARIIPYSCTTPRAQQAKRIFKVFNLPLEWTFAMIIGLNRGKVGKEEQVQPKYWMAWLFDKTFRFSRWMHDWVLVPGLRVSGRCLEERELVVERRRIEEELLLLKAAVDEEEDVYGGGVVVVEGEVMEE